MRSAILLSVFLLIDGNDPATLYRYTDNQGTAHIIDRLAHIPARYRDRAIAISLVTIHAEDERAERTKSVATLNQAGSVEMRSTPTGRSVVALFDEEIERNVLIDTGSEISIVTRKLALALGKDPDRADTGRFRTPAGSIQAPVIWIDSLRIGNGEVTRLKAAVIDFAGRGVVSGVIGMNYLSRFVFEVDPVEEQLRFQSLSQ